MASRKMIILGAGESGTGAAILAKKQGWEVFSSDFSEITPKYKAMLNSHGIEWEEKQHTEERILNADEIVKSPGISNQTPIIKKVLEQNIPLISEIEFAGRYTNAKTICITGSNGKTTTALLTYHILKQAGLNAGLAGNIGKSFALQVAEEKFDYYVLELSSFQLENIYRFKADIAIILNITPDHLNRYDYRMQNYVDAKFRILQNQTEKDALIYWNDDPIIRAEIAKLKPAATLYPFAEEKAEELKGYTENGELTVNIGAPFTMAQNLLALSGTHNLYNSLAAAIAAKLLGIPHEKICKALHTFKGVEHRIERVAQINGVEYINDSKATNVNSCRYALQSIQTPIVLILGGIDKGNDYTEIEPLVHQKVKALIFLGTDNAKLHAFFEGKVSRIEETLSMQEAVSKAHNIAAPGDTVLLSPCSDSRDLFKNYEDRGKQFKIYVMTLTNE